MSKVKMEWCKYEGLNKNSQTMSKESYKEKYRGNLTCIHGCEARIKFTEKNNGSKFYSTWNNEGNKHKDSCEFHVNYNGKAGRKRLIIDENKKEITEDQIRNAIIRNFKELKKIYNKINNGEEAQSTNLIENLGNKNIAKLTDKEGSVSNVTGRTNVITIEADTINSTYNEIRKCVVGIGKNIQFYDEAMPYGYLNLKSEYYDVATYFPEAFFADNNISVTDFKKISDIINKEIKEHNRKITVICFGKITNKKKKKNDYNINVISPDHIMINEMALNDILISGKIKELNI